MPKLAANINLLFSDLPFLDRIDSAAEAGFRAVECVAPLEASAQALRMRFERTG
jgi:hydroxypyruvate isomerase